MIFDVTLGLRSDSKIPPAFAFSAFVFPIPIDNLIDRKKAFMI
jgi:hypothetical protein